ncbi:MAG: histidine kinase [Paludibacter sp.]
MAFVFLILFLLPVVFTRVQGEISWIHVLKIWKDQSLLFVVFGLNHWLIAPKLLLRKKYGLYILCIAAIISISSLSYYYYDNVLTTQKIKTENTNKPTPIPPYAHLLMYSLLIVGVDSGLLFSKKWYENEENKHMLEVKNAEMQLDMLRYQVSPHFLMNTLNNIYALIDLDSPKAKEAVMKLSKLMRYMLYENESGKVLISKEFEFVKSYIDLMKLRFDKDMIIELNVPEKYDEFEIPPLLFISFIENAFKHGGGNEQRSKIVISFCFEVKILVFKCFNLKSNSKTTEDRGGSGLENSKNRLNMFYGERYSLSISSMEKYFDVTLKIPTT